MWNNLRDCAVRIAGGLAIVCMVLGASCEETPKKERAGPGPKKESVTKGEAPSAQKPKPSGGDAGKKAEAAPEKGRPGPAQAGGQSGSGEGGRGIGTWRADLTSPDRDFRAFAAISLLRSGDKGNVDLLISMLGTDATHGSKAPDDIRLTIVRAFQFEGNDAAAEPLIALLMDENADVRHAAAEALGALRSGQASS